MRILHIINSSHVGGTERALAGLLEFSAAKGVDNYVITLLPPGPMDKEYVRSSREVFSLNLTRGSASLGGAIRAINKCRQIRPHLIVTWMYQADLLAAFLQIATIGQIPVVWNLRTSATVDLVGRTSGVVRSLCAHLSKYVPSKIVCNSPAVQAAHTEIGYHCEQMVVIPNGYDLTVFKPNRGDRDSVRAELGIPMTSKLVGMFARWDPAKDYKSFLNAAAQISGRHSDVHFLLSGEGTELARNEISKLSSVSDCVRRFHVMGLRHDMARLHASLDIGVLMSRMNEGFPNSIAESMACGVPCIVSDAGGAAYVVGNAGRVVPKGDVDSLVCEMNQLLSLSCGQLRAMGNEARKRIASSFDMNEVAGRHLGLWRSLCSSHAEVRDELSQAA